MAEIRDNRGKKKEVTSVSPEKYNVTAIDQVLGYAQDELDEMPVLTAHEVELLNKFFLANWKMSMQMITTMGRVFLNSMMSGTNFAEAMVKAKVSFDDKSELIIMNVEDVAGSENAFAIDTMWVEDDTDESQEKVVWGISENNINAPQTIDKCEE